MSARLRRVLIAALCGVLLWQVWQHVARGARAAPVASLTPAPPDELQLGRLQLKPCTIGQRRTGVPTLAAYCTRFTVPEDWGAPRGRQIDLKVAVLGASSAAPEPDPVVFLDGGPGGAASEDFPGIAPAFELLRRRHRVLLLDQRGTGGSNPLGCQDSEQGPSGRAATVAPAAEATRRDLSTQSERLRACVLRLAAHAAPQFYTTSVAVRDLEALRAALGGPRLNLLGISYGTRVAQQYAHRYPQAVRTVVLDSAVPNDLALGAEQARNLEDALRALAGRCRAVADCARAYGDPYALLQRVQARLRAQPQTLTLRDPYTFAPAERQVDAAQLAQLVRFYAYNPLTAALIPYVLREAEAGRYAPLLGQTQLVVGELADHLDNGMALSVICTEDVDLLRARPQDADTLLGNDLLENLQSACRIWPHGGRPADFHEPLRSDLPVLLLAGENDPVTPPRYALAIARALSHARVLTLRGQGHGLVGVGCVPRLLEEFVRRADAAALDVQCLQQLGSTPAFLDANGAGP